MSAESLDFVLSSETRLRILSFLSDSSLTPTQLAKQVEKHLSHISRALKELEKMDLVSCENPSNYKPRQYCLTPQGDKVLKEIYQHRVRISLF